MHDPRRIQELFWEASEQPSAARRSFLEARCAGDSELLEEVASLLEAAAVEDSFLDAPPRVGSGSAAGLEGHDEPRAPPMPGSIGPYRILRVLGEGGMGVVYLAEQEAPIRRRVALKAIQVGLSSREVLSRFEGERQALALMNHPNISSVHEAGAMDDGRPYFVMEYVDGAPVTSYCESRGFTIQERVRLFLQVCDGAEHAHARGIVHRDLKPSNILVCEADGCPRVKLIDFGVAKATNHAIAQRTLYTELGRIVGTPSYMSPEQARLTSEAIDPRSDVYSLGAVLHELLAGEPPLEIEGLAKLSCDEVFRRIREEEPRPPSVRFALLSRERAAQLARSRGSTPERVAESLRGDLDWIALKALEKEPFRRYASAAALAADLRRHLSDEPVLAGPPSLLYRGRKFVRKNRGPFIGAVAVIAALVLGLSIALHQSLEAKKHSRLADRRLEQVLRLGDSKLLAECDEEAEKKLWPATSAKVPDMERWLERARALSARLPEHEASLAQLNGSAADGERLDVGWWRESMVQLVEGLRRLAGRTIPAIERRLRMARESARTSLVDAAGEWASALRSIADPSECPAYGGLSIPPQEGIVPIGRNPRSGLWEFAHLLSGEPARRGPAGEPIVEEGTGIVLVLIPGGTIAMGEAKEAGSASHFDPAQIEAPINEVKLDPYFIAKFELTEGQWLHFAGEKRIGPTITPLHVSPTPLLQPVKELSWHESMEFLFRMGLVLPTEAQWELAARAGTKTKWWTGFDVESLQGAANLGDRTAASSGWHAPGVGYERSIDDGYGFDAPVGRFRPNAFGLHDTAGNVSEWCRDAFAPYTRPVRQGTGERIPASEVITRVRRGGDWSNNSWMARSAARLVSPADYRHHSLGVRAARSVHR